MGEADVVIDDIDPPVEIHARLLHALDVIMAGHVGANCVGRTVLLMYDLDRFLRGVLVDIGA